MMFWERLDFDLSIQEVLQGLLIEVMTSHFCAGLRGHKRIRCGHIREEASH